MPEDLHVQRAKAQPTLPCFIASTHILRNPGLDQLLHEGSRHGLVGLETDRGLADLVIFEFVLVVAQHAVNRAVMRVCAIPHEASAVEPESRELVADVLFRLWHGSPDYVFV
jgi:hypothetical protein